MTRITKPTALELANTYAKFFVEDFTTNVMAHLKGSHAIPQDVLTSLLDTKVSEIATESLQIANTNEVGRFLFECANFALESDMTDVTARSTWDHVSALPSVHHIELNRIAYHSADLYRTTIDKTVIGTITKDADTTARLITQAAQARGSDTETGGSFNLFSWGVLNDGLWLNNALMRAQDRANIFKPDRTPTVTWANQAFNFAHQAAAFKTFDEHQRIDAQAEINLLISLAPADAIDPLLQVFSQTQLNNFLFSSAQQRMHIEHWDKSRNNPKDMMANVGDMSTIVRMLELLQSVTSNTNNDVEISDAVRERLTQTIESVTMSLVGYEVMRETRFADTLILRVEGEGKDPKVDVFVNADNISNYRAAQGSDEELVQFGLHLDPRAGMPASANGWSLQYVLDRRDNILPQIATEDANRLEMHRNNDAVMIRDQAASITRDAVQSYLSARDIDRIPNALNTTINRFSMELTKENSDICMDRELTSMLSIAQGDPFVQKATDVFVGYLNEDSPFAKHARAATVATLALTDAIEYITAADVTE